MTQPILHFVAWKLIRFRFGGKNKLPIIPCVVFHYILILSEKRMHVFMIFTQVGSNVIITTSRTYTVIIAATTE